ncbi:MAG: zinc-ribbon domain-containing protein [Deltaproteobacteria bacterium]|nr:zinc-ribbon domain-containing protein [Deltaproteobacteria bacterium]
MKCPKCHIENPDDNKFCRECGAALLLACDGCGHELQAGDRFCGQCGRKVVEEAKEETTRLATEGERKHVTVLFSDLSGYTAMSEKLDPEEVKEITGRIFGEVSKIIAKYDGFVEKYAGQKAQTHYNKAIQQAKKVGDKGTLGRCYLDLGILHRAKKRFDKAKKCFLRAIEIFEETEADGYLTQAKEAMESLEN